MSKTLNFFFNPLLHKWCFAVALNLITEQSAEEQNNVASITTCSNKFKNVVDSIVVGY
jgi:hypothetical protein